MIGLREDLKGKVFYPGRPRAAANQGRNPYLEVRPIGQEPNDPPLWRLDIHDEAGALICWSAPLHRHALHSTVAMFLDAGWRLRGPAVF